MVNDFGFTRATAHFEPGDVILFGSHFMHSSIPNRTNRYRIQYRHALPTRRRGEEQPILWGSREMGRQLLE
jgi:hypothetical protein